MGRHEQPALDDTSQFPWNRSASARDSRSRQGSLARGYGGFGSSVGGFGTSGGRQSSLPLIVGGSLDRRASRITSASPLIGRSRPTKAPRSDDIPQFDDNDLLGGPSTSIAGDVDFQIYGPAASVDTQTAAQSQWMRATLDAESNNFLEFIKAEISRGEDEPQDELAEPVVADSKSVLFEELLPPAQNSRIVAAQGLLHTLTLATKGLIRVRQEEDYGPIALALGSGI